MPRKVTLSIVSAVLFWLAFALQLTTDVYPGFVTTILLVGSLGMSGLAAARLLGYGE